MRRGLLLASALVLSFTGYAANAEAKSLHPLPKHMLHRLSSRGHEPVRHVARRRVFHPRHFVERAHVTRLRHIAYHGGGRWLECVAYASRVSGIDLPGDAYQWWREAEGRYERGQQPVDGAVLSFKSRPGMALGHVAVVAETVNDRKILVDQAHWPEPGLRGGDISHAIAVIDVSPRNDWTRVRVEIGHSGRFGDVYPTNGFIYQPGHGPLLADAGQASAAAAAAINDHALWRQSVQFASAPDSDDGIATSAPDRAIK